MFSSIVVGTDGGPTSRGAVQHAADLAKLTGGTVHLVRGYKVPSHGLATMPMDAMVMPTTSTDAEITAEIEREMAALASDLTRDGVVAKTYACPTSNAAGAILDVAGHQSADLIIVGNKGLHGARRVLGSVPKTIVHEAPCAVLIVHTT